MKRIKLIQKSKAFFIRFKLHKIIGYFADILIFIGYLSKLSEWANKHKKDLKFNDFYNPHIKHTNREKLYHFLVETEGLFDNEINYLEFGVGRGNSMRWWSANNRNKNSILWGFDTFEGLPEKWGDYEVGTFSLDGKFPQINDSRIKYIKGLFQDTLYKTINKINFDKKIVLHLDADLYGSTLFPLSVLCRYLKKDDIIIFDEFGVPLHEFKAFKDFNKVFNINLKPLGAINNYLKIAFKVY
jgi:hypothetical protein